MKRRMLPLLGALLFLLAACSPKDPAPTVSPTPSVTPAPTVSQTPEPTPTPTPTQAPAPVWGEQVSECSRYDKTEGDVLLVSGKFSLPLIENAGGVAAYEAINNYYLDLSAGLRSDTLANAPQAAEDYTLSKAMDYPFSPYSDEETFEIKRETSRMVSVLRTHYGYTGGVYPTLLYLSDNFDLTTGEKLTFADFFTDPDQAETLIRSTLQTAADHGVDDDEAVRLNALLTSFKRENFYLTDDAMVFFTQPDQDTPHAAGAAEGSVSFTALGGLLVDWN